MNSGLSENVLMISQKSMSCNFVQSSSYLQVYSMEVIFRRLIKTWPLSNFEE